MPDDRLIVLKFGGSILRDERSLRLAVHEIYRWRREGWQVIAVVSAFAGVTDQLVEQCERQCPNARDHSSAAVLASGELQSAALLTLQLDRAGIFAACLTPAAINLLAQGDPLDAWPVSVDVTRVRKALDRSGVVVVPGFVAIDDSGQTVTLGRGGSDLTAVFLAGALDAQVCRLIKDVDGLYVSDPNQPGARPSRYLAASYEDTLATDGSIIQYKAVASARNQGREFQIARFNGASPTRVSAEHSTYADDVDAPRRLRVALLGLGTVGAGVYELLMQIPEMFEIVGVASRTVRSAQALGIPPERWTGDAVGLAASGADVVVEMMGGSDTALRSIIAALDAGSHVVTANKAVLAEHWSTITRRLADSDGVLLASASVGGGVPVLEACQAGANRIASVQGVLNGTANAVLESMAAGYTLDDAVWAAQDAGFAERDPSRDLDGLDAIDKIRVIAHTIGIPPSDLEVARCDRIARGSPLRGRAQIASIDRTGRIEVRLEEPLRGSHFAELRGESNAVIIGYADGTHRTLAGRGAGRWPTAESVMADLLQISRMTDRSQREESTTDASEPHHV